MKDSVNISDANARQQALEPGRSYIVQAPAGSGKTELLMQRYLALLCTIDYPEEIFAITFTRKATAEMRGRIVAALDKAATEKQPELPHEINAWRLAKQVLEKDHFHDWNLRENPNRLRILTIDALSAKLTHQMPVLSRAGVNLKMMSDNDTALYRQAAIATLEELENDQAWSSSIATLINHLDNNWQKLIDMLISLLRKRDHWLRHLPVELTEENIAQERHVLEAAFQSIIEKSLADLIAVFPQEHLIELIELTSFAGEILRQEGKDDKLIAYAGNHNLPTDKINDLDHWLVLIESLLIDSGAWRKTVNIKQGFPPESAANNAEEKIHYKSMKNRMEKLLGTLQDNTKLQQQLLQVKQLPAATFTSTQWDILKALFMVLKLAVAQLQLVFKEAGEVDFVEINLAALRALGGSESPTELALALDYKLKHLLVDEFQDTSVTHYSLLHKLTSGWQAGDGRSLFLVGDPMQSIYRFREAEVGLFLNVQQQKRFGQIPVEPLELTVNFRSEATIVDWVNTTFEQIMPEQNNTSSGAVCYTRSKSFKAASPTSQVEFHPAINDLHDVASTQVCALAKTALKEEKTVAVLVKSRSHLSGIIRCMKQAKIAYQAIEIDPLSQQPVILDLKALTCALLHLADRVHWLSILRAPWCGLCLDDLEKLAANNSSTLWRLINDQTHLSRLTNDGQQRLQRLQQVLLKAFDQRQRHRLSDWVEWTWRQLGGEACLQTTAEIENAKTFFDQLDKLENARDPSSFAQLDQALGSLYASSLTKEKNIVQVMTIHKSKGLEFDTVILPELQRQPRNDNRALLQWTEQANQQGNNDLLLAPIEETGADKESIYLYLSELEKIRSNNERVRLLYVAATRAREQLHLFASVSTNNKNEIKKPDPRSLLKPLWPVVADKFETQLSTMDKIEIDLEEAKPARVFIRRLPVHWQAPEPTENLTWRSEKQEVAEKKPEKIEFSWASDQARHVGTVVHRLLEQVAQDGVEKWSPEKIKAQSQWIENMLIESGIPTQTINGSVAKVISALQNTLNDHRGKWILQKHEQAENEYPLTGVQNGEVLQVILDRTFVDEDNIRWIIDYKTGAHKGQDTESFLDNEKIRYQAQLTRYADLMRGMETRQIKLGLYFPLLKGWREWKFEN